VRVAVQPADGLGQAMSAGHVGQADRDSGGVGDDG
jgi:hypothetical protein